ncbi:MAG: GtrA family protein [Candidatus Staskawiczbacteria bacterium]|nr:GtrA family protein [Candidatus Staskawiczbacteria bacterium]
MNKFDGFFSIFCGWTLTFLVRDFLRSGGVHVSFFYGALLWISLPLLSLLCLWIAYQISKKLPFMFQVGKHVLVGTFATVVDAKFFEFLLAVIIPLPLVSKGVSFFISTLIKYSGNKYWTFQKNERENWHIEAGKFVAIILVGLAIDVSIFHYLTTILGPQFSINIELWRISSVVASAVVAAIWNFTGDKFLVFKK